jgi:hypothetical protein
VPSEERPLSEPKMSCASSLAETRLVGAAHNHTGRRNAATPGGSRRVHSSARHEGGISCSEGSSRRSRLSIRATCVACQRPLPVGRPEHLVVVAGVLIAAASVLLLAAITKAKTFSNLHIVSQPSVALSPASENLAPHPVPAGPVFLRTFVYPLERFWSIARYATCLTLNRSARLYPPCCDPVGTTAENVLLKRA